MVATATALERFRAAPWNAAGTYPWLSPQPGSPDRAVAGTLRGGLAVHRPGGFDTGFVLWWGDARDHPIAAAPRAGEEGLAGLRIEVPEGRGRCVWETAAAFVCRGTGVLPGSTGGGSGLGSGPVLVSFDLTASRPTVRPPGAGSLRTRGMHLAGELPPGSWVEVRGIGSLGERGYRAESGARVRLALTGVRYALAPPEEIPAWFVEHGWQRLIWVALGAGVAPGGDGGCGGGYPACPTLRVGKAVHTVPGVIVGAGPPLAGQRRDAGARLSDYLEGANARPDAMHFVAGPQGPGFNDRVWPIGRIRSGSRAEEPR